MGSALLSQIALIEGVNHSSRPKRPFTKGALAKISSLRRLINFLFESHQCGVALHQKHLVVAFTKALTNGSLPRQAITHRCRYLKRRFAACPFLAKKEGLWFDQPLI